VVGFSTTPPPKFVRRYADVAGIIRKALAGLAEDMRRGAFPGPDEVYGGGEDLPEDWDRLEA